MADMSSLSTRKLVVAGNKRWEIWDIPGGGTTADHIVSGLRFPEAAFGNFRGTTVGSSSAPVATLGGTTVAINQLAATTGASYTITVIGR